MTEFVNEGMTKKNNDIDGDWSRYTPLIPTLDRYLDQQGQQHT